MRMKKFMAGSAALTLTALISASTIVPANAAQLSDPFASRMYDLVNQHRIANGLNPLVWNQSVANVSQNWSDTMDPTIEAEGDAGFRHNPTYSAQIPGGFVTAAENIAINSSPDSLFQAWVNSPLHNANMLNANMTDFGFGYAYLDSGKYATQYFATQNFAGYRSVTVPVVPAPVDPVASPISLLVSTGTVTAGGTVLVSGTTVQSSVDLKLTYNFGSTTGVPFFSVQELTLTPNVDGAFSYEFAIPSDALAGSVEIYANAVGDVATTLVSVVPAPVEEAPVEEAPVEEAPVEEAPVEEAPVEEAPVEEAPVDEAPVEEAPVEEAPVEEAPVDEAPVDEAPVDEAPVDEAPVDEAPVDEAPVEEAPVDEAPVDEAPVEEAPVEEAPVDEAPVDEGPDMTIPGGEDAAPVASNDPSDDVLDDANRGIVSITESEDGKSIVVAGLVAGKEYNVWFQSTPLNAGNFTAQANGSIVVSVPETLETGTHKIAVYETNGALVGWDPFTVEVAVAEETPVVVAPVEEAPVAETPADELPVVITLDEEVASDVQVEEVVQTEEVPVTDETITAENENLAETSKKDGTNALGLFAGGLLLILGLVTAVSRRVSLTGIKK